MSSHLNILLPILVIQLILLIVALFDIAKSEKTNGPKWMWVCIVLFISLLGSVAYFVFGRRND